MSNTVYQNAVEMLMLARAIGRPAAEVRSLEKQVAEFDSYATADRRAAVHAAASTVLRAA